MAAPELVAKKKAYMAKLVKLFTENKKVLIFNADNVGAYQIQKVRLALRGIGTVLLGKNTLIRKAFNDNMKAIPDLAKILPLVRGNIGFVFTNEDVATIRTKVEELKQKAPAKAGQVSPVTVIVPAGSTGMEPTKTSFFQSLDIATKITRGCVDIINDVVLLKPGDKVSASHATLLQMMDIQPFSYGLKVTHVYDEGSVYEAKILDLTDDDKRAKFLEGVKRIASIGLATGIANQASVPHLLINSFKQVLNVSVATSYDLAEAKEIKAYLEDPSKFASSAPVASAPSASAPAAKVVESESESSEGDVGFGDLF